MSAQYSLDQSLPSDVALNSSWAATAYRKYPVFSKPWFYRRTLLFALILLPLSLLVIFGTGLTSGWSTGFLVGGYFFLAFMSMIAAGPALATWVRYRRWSLNVERSAVVIAVLCGMLISYFADQYASNYMSKQMKVAELRTENIRDPVVRAAMEDAKRNADKAKLRISKNPKRHSFLNLLIIASIYASLGGGLSLRAYFSEQRRIHQSALNAMRLKVSESDMRLGVLQAQIEPHFLFNTLASIRSLIHQDPQRAEQTLDALVNHLRITIPKLRAEQGSLQSSLGQQLDVCASYLDLMKLRMGERLHYSIDVADELRNLPFPPLMLISLVENAIKHGLEPKVGTGQLIISAQRLANHRMQVSVSDDGVGLKAVLSSGVGLSNLREQLQLRYGDQAQLHISNRNEGGVIARIELPIAGIA
jgi:hypothetical protein